MAVGTVSGVNLDDQWALINTTTITSGTTLTFSSLSGYKKLMLTYTGFTQSGSGSALLSLNGTTTNTWGIYIFLQNVNNQSIAGVPLNYTGFYANNQIGFVVIDGTTANSPVKKINGLSYSDNGYQAEIEGAAISSNEVTSVSVTSPSAFTGGTFKIYGIVA
jgi:hypothetical protein